MLLELCDQSDVTHALRGVDVAMGILVSIGGDPDCLLRDYLEEVLRMNVQQFMPSAKVSKAYQRF